jgi:hypothetical protein
MRFSFSEFQLFSFFQNQSERPAIAAQPDRGGEECRGECQPDPETRAAQE